MGRDVVEVENLSQKKMILTFCLSPDVLNEITSVFLVNKQSYEVPTVIRNQTLLRIDLTPLLTKIDDNINFLVYMQLNNRDRKVPVRLRSTLEAQPKYVANALDFQDQVALLTGTVNDNKTIGVCRLKNNSYLRQEVTAILSNFSSEMNCVSNPSKGSSLFVEQFSVEQATLRLKIKNIENVEDLKIGFFKRSNRIFCLTEVNQENQTLVIDLSRFFVTLGKEGTRYSIGILSSDGSIYHPIVYPYKYFEHKFNRYYHQFKLQNPENSNNDSQDERIVPYFSEDNELSLVVGKQSAVQSEASGLKTTIINVDIINKVVILTFTLANPQNLNLKLKAVRYQSRTKIAPEIFDVPVEINSESKAVAKLDLTKIELNHFYYDAFAIVEIDGYELQIEVKKSDATLRKRVQTRIKGHDYSDWTKRKVIYPIFIGNNFRLAMRDRDDAENPYDFLKYQIAFWLYRIFKNHFNRKKIWLTYEKESKRAEDNSFYFFQYMYQHHPNQNVYFVMNVNAQNFKATKPYKSRILKFMSIKHLIYLQAAELFVSSETPGHAFPWREKRGRIKKIVDKKPFVFLQHGVLGLKKVGRGLNKSGANSANLFVVSSQREHQLVVDNMHYLPNEVIITGLPRWDAINHNPVSKPANATTIFIMPTWRSWLEDADEESFRKSLYFRYYNDLLSSDKFGKFLLDNNIEVRFLLHPKMRKYLNLFDKVSPNIVLLSDEETQVNIELQNANILVTDYSSVAWEMLYRGKPTIFYQFDRNLFDLFTGSYINLDKELFGVNVSDVNELIDNIGTIKAKHFQLTQEQDSYRKKAFKFIDNRNSERVYQSITDSNILSAFTKISLTKKVIKRIRKKFTN